ncbi:carbohydrate ABC transporter permease [Paenibacillus gansuensis]|uniref:Carbohydrate ABC transporter permease n=1 Tax=Paenibacillus gansuensis TaxID=306542 RepID=A0ABW5P834_9BACL
MKNNAYLKLSSSNPVLAYGILGLLAIIFLLPLLWVILSSVDSNATVSLQAPRSLTLDHYKDVIGNKEQQRAFINGLLLSIGATLIVLVLAGFAAYPLSRYQFKTKRMYLFTILFATGLPLSAVMIPVYQIFVYFNLHNSLLWTSVFMAATALPVGIWMLKNFMDSIPYELEEAAWMDGASAFQTLTRIMVPLMLPGLFAVSITLFSGAWGNFLVPFLLLQSPDKVPVSVTVFQFFGQYGMVEYGKLAAFSILYTVPIVALYAMGQRYMSQGFSFGGAAKG